MSNKRKSSKKKSSSSKKRSQMSLDLEDLVGSDVYGTWIKMLKALVPWGRTHRLSVLVAGMLQYAWYCRNQARKDNPLIDLIDESNEIGMDYDDQEKLILPVIEQMFKDAGVRWKRTNARGQGYSIAEQTMDDFLRWDFMPWE